MNISSQGNNIMGDDNFKFQDSFDGDAVTVTKEMIAQDALLLDPVNLQVLSTSDYYLNNKNVIDRLVEEWKTHDKLVIAYDYDNTVNDYHNKGYEFYNVINLLRDCKTEGAYLIVSTSCSEPKYEDIKKDLTERNIPFDSINENAPFIKFLEEDKPKKWWMFWKKNNVNRKLYYNILLDDRAGLFSAYCALFFALTKKRYPDMK